MSADFPNSPVAGDTHTINGIKYIYTNNKWSITPSRAIQKVVPTAGNIDLYNGLYHKIDNAASNASLDITFSNTYITKFTTELNDRSNNGPVAVTWPSGIYWDSGTSPVYQANTTLIVDIFNISNTFIGIEQINIYHGTGIELNAESIVDINSDTYVGYADIETANSLTGNSTTELGSMSNYNAGTGTTAYILSFHNGLDSNNFIGVAGQSGISSISVNGVPYLITDAGVPGVTFGSFSAGVPILFNNKNYKISYEIAPQGIFTFTSGEYDTGSYGFINNTLAPPDGIGTIVAGSITINGGDVAAIGNGILYMNGAASGLTNVNVDGTNMALTYGGYSDPYHLYTFTNTVILADVTDYDVILT